jgi:hypothetical protein
MNKFAWFVLADIAASRAQPTLNVAAFALSAGDDEDDRGSGRTTA